MSNKYKISTLLDIMQLEDDQIDRLCAELPGVIKYAKAFKALIDAAGEVASDDDRATKILMPLTWIDDGKTEITVTAKCADDEVITMKVS